MVIIKKGNMVVPKNKAGHIITHYSSFFKFFEYEHSSIDNDLHELANGNSALEVDRPLLRLFLTKNTPL